MDALIATIEAPHRLKNIPDFRVGDVIKVHQRIREGGKERIQIFEGLVIAKKHGTGMNGTFMVRRIASGVGVERIFPLHSPKIAKIERVRSSHVRRAKLYYIRGLIGKKAKLKGVDAYASWEEPAEVEEVVTEEAETTETEEAPTQEEMAEAAKLEAETELPEEVTEVTSDSAPETVESSGTAETTEATDDTTTEDNGESGGGASDEATPEEGSQDTSEKSEK